MSEFRRALEEKFSQAMSDQHGQIFTQFLPPSGVLSPDPACHALWRYANVVKSREEKKEGPQYEDDPIDYMRDLKTVFLSMATLYKVSPDAMLKFWINVDMQMRLLGSVEMIKKEYRFDAVPDILAS